MSQPGSTNDNEWASAFFDPAFAAPGLGVAAAATLPRFTDHSYHDFSTYIEDGGTIAKHKKSDRNFPARLHAILSDEQYSHIISWMPHGRAWKVLDKKLLVEEVIPKYFGQSKFASFTRQLSGWGFKRLHQTGPDFGCYYHECFLRGHPRLTVLMRRISPGQGKATRNVDSEPDFYLIAKQYPLHATGEKPVNLSKFEDNKEGKDKSSGRKKTPRVSPQIAPTSFDIDPIPVSINNNLEPLPLAAVASAPRYEASAYQHQSQMRMMSHDQYVGKTEGNAGHMDTSHVFSGLRGVHHPYRNVQSQAQPQTATAVAAICSEDRLCSNDGTSVCHWGSHYHHYPVGVGHYHYQYPPHNVHSQFHDPMMFTHSRQAWNRGQYQPTHHSSASAASRPNRLSPNSWSDTAATEDPLKDMPMSVPEEGFDFNISSLED